MVEVELSPIITLQRYKLVNEAHTKNTLRYFPPNNIFLKSSCALPCALSPEDVGDLASGAEEVPAAAAAGGGFLARPNPARGLEAALRGMKIPPPAVEALRAFAGVSSPSENRSRTPLNSRGSGSRSNRAASAGN
jgi:hypothetical protein